MVEEIVAFVFSAPGIGVLGGVLMAVLTFVLGRKKGKQAQRQADTQRAGEVARHNQDVRIKAETDAAQKKETLEEKTERVLANPARTASDVRDLIRRTRMKV